ncbi:MAG: sigma-70 family RNA polymerase sigma factor [Anaerolineales bacterium]|nr:sigma-70 family RNA polymerase sigma factor [Anaerolineales bacterium]
MVHEFQFDQAVCTYHVTQFMLGQAWQLVEPHVLAAAIYVDLRERGLDGAAAVQAIRPQILGRYAVIVYERCCDPTHVHNSRAWQELRGWLQKQTYNIAIHVNDREDVLQETMLQLQTTLDNAGLAVPRTLWMYALQVLKRKAIDMYRVDTAVSRGGGTITLSLEDMSAEGIDRAALAGTQHALTGLDERRIENSVSNREARTELKAFFQQQLRSEQQQLVAELHFLDGLSPKEIAALLGKKPHEIRMVKARVIQTLRALPTDEQERLLRILDAAAEEEVHDS